MHSLRCLRIMQMKTIVIIGFISVSITFLLFLYYTSHQPQIETEAPSFVFKHHFLEKPQQLIRKKEKLIELSENEFLLFAKDTRPALSSPRLAKYCNRAHNHMEGQEGLAPATYKLMSVHTVIRHGDRSPIYKLPKGVSSELSCLVDTEPYSHVSKVVNFKNVMAAEMSKSPSEGKSFLRWSLFPSHEICGEGQLTGQGAIQHILNGIHFSERYVHKHGLISSDNWHEKVLIHSTEISRTYQSAIAFAYGLLPNFDINRLVIRTSQGMSFCEDRAFGIACQCAKMEQFRLKAESECKTNPQIKKSYQKYKLLLAYASKALDISPYAIPGPTSLMDGLSGFTCHNKPLPCNVNGSCITTRSIEALWKIIDAKSDCLTQSESYRMHARALMHGLLFRIARNMNISSVNGTNANFHLYSGHDTTVTPLIAALELTDNVWPGYAHMITFELWKGRENKEDFIRVLQNSHIVTHQVIFCKNKTNKDGMCGFKHFLEYLSSRNLKSFCYSKESI